MKDMNINNVIKRYLIWGFLVLLSIGAVIPLIYTVTNSFVSAQEFSHYFGTLGQFGQGSPFHIIPDRITLEGYYQVLLNRPDYLLKFWISLGISGLIVAGQVIISVLGGYAFAKFRFPGRDVLFFIVIIIMMAPPQVTLVPNYIMLDRLGWIGGYHAVIVPGIFSAFGVFLMRQFMAGVPDDMLEAAKLDGAGSFRNLLLMLANCRGAISALVVLSFIDSWNMVEQPLIFLRDAFKYPMSIFLTWIFDAEPALGFVCGLLAMLPALYLFLYCRDELVNGIGQSIIK